MREKEFIKYYKAYSKNIFKFCRFKTSNKQEAEDITSEVFLDLFGQNLTHEKEVKAWLYKVARNKIYDFYNKPLKSDYSTDLNIEEIDESKFKTQLNPEKVAIDNGTVLKIESHIQNLDDLTSEIILLRLWFEFSFVEISKITDLKLDATKKRFEYLGF